MGQIAHLSLGSNIGNRELHLKEAIKRINSSFIQIEKTSRIYETPPWGFEAEQHFLNMCITIKTHLSPIELLQLLQKIEIDLGRKQKTHVGYASRNIDIDILTYGQLEINSKELQIPHPRMEDRNFVLLPLQEIAPDFSHPKTAKKINLMIADCTDKSSVKVYESK